MTVNTQLNWNVNGHNKKQRMNGMTTELKEAKSGRSIMKIDFHSGH